MKRFVIKLITVMVLLLLCVSFVSCTETKMNMKTDEAVMTETAEPDKETFDPNAAKEEIGQTSEPTEAPTPEPTIVPTPEPTIVPTPVPTAAATAAPTPAQAAQAPAAAEASKPDAEAESGYVYIGKSGTKYHRESCRTLKGKGTKVSLAEAKKRGHKEPCKVCKP